MLKNGSRPYRVLVAGDKEELRPLIAALAQSEHHELIEAGDGAGALLLLRQGVADTAVLDLTVLGIDPDETLQEIRRMPGSVSDSRDIHFAVEVMKAGAADFMLKPVPPRELLESIRHVERSSCSRAGAGAPRQPEAEARQADRLQTLGRLTSSVAHEMNNQMTVMLGYSNLVLRQVSPGDPLADHLKEINRAAERAASLSRQLLDYGRKRAQPPQAVDLNRLVAGMAKMLERLAGEQITLELALDAAPALVKADAPQLEQVILNLVLNARDAMPQGGALTIATRNRPAVPQRNGTNGSAAAQPRVLLLVSDDGCGMDPQTRSRIFEPYFTTKAPDQGTGLGLSIIAKLVKQCGGAIHVASSPGQGATFTIALPVAGGADSPVELNARLADLPRGSETVLVVEDNDEVRGLLENFLSGHGYTILEAQDYSQALRLCQQHDGAIDLLLTDVALPFLDGPEVAARLSVLRPGMKVLYMSGYSNPRLSLTGQDDEDVPFIQKPFSTDKLAAKVREVLNHTGHPGSRKRGPSG